MGVNEMQHCENCKVQLKGTQKICPLCGGIIQDSIEEKEEVFPQIPTIYQKYNLFIRIMILISISAVIISFAVNFIFSRQSHWSLLVAAGILCMWICMYFIIRKKNNIPKTIIWQVILVCILSVLWDRSMGWRGWSIDYVIPSACVVALIVLAVSAIIIRIGARELTVYLFIDGVIGFVPIIFLFTGLADVKFPSVICVAASAISVTAILIFEWDNMKSELNKRMHI